MNPVFAYPGGKRRMLKYILPVIPAHDTYIEPFAGGLAEALQSNFNTVANGKKFKEAA